MGGDIVATQRAFAAISAQQRPVYIELERREDQMRFISLIVFIYVLSILWGCESDDPIAIDEPTAVKVAIKVEPMTVRSGDEFSIEVELVNVGGSPVFIKYCCCCDTLAYYLTDAHGAKVSDWMSAICTPCSIKIGDPFPGFDLGPHQKVAKTFRESTEFKEIGTRRYERLPAGVYVVHAGDRYKSQHWATAHILVRDN
jgi:hypothetical protein